MDPPARDRVDLGLIRGRVRVIDSDPGWPTIFQGLAADLRPALAGLAAAIEHIGSTAVPDLPSKPILDIAIRMTPRASATTVIDALAPSGYRYRGDAGDDGGLIFALEDRPDHRLANIHVVCHDDPQWRRWLTVRDRLRNDPAARTAYADLKHRLAARHPDDRRAYTAGKSSFITELLDGR